MQQIEEGENLIKQRMPSICDLIYRSIMSKDSKISEPSCLLKFLIQPANENNMNYQ